MRGRKRDGKSGTDACTVSTYIPTAGTYSTLHVNTLLSAQYDVWAKPTTGLLSCIRAKSIVAQKGYSTVLAMPGSMFGACAPRWVHVSACVPPAFPQRCLMRKGCAQDERRSRSGKRCSGIERCITAGIVLCRDTNCGFHLPSTYTVSNRSSTLSYLTESRAFLRALVSAIPAVHRVA